jgi:predicted nucleic acid-binding protein
VILVDTSVLIDYLKGQENKQTLLFDSVIESGIEYGINFYIFLEIMQGSKNQKEYETLQKYLTSLTIYCPPNDISFFEKTALLNMRCRKKGITIRSTIDLIIAQTAMDYSLFLLHRDTDYDRIAEIDPKLKIWKGTN